MISVRTQQLSISDALKQLVLLWYGIFVWAISGMSLPSLASQSDIEPPATGVFIELSKTRLENQKVNKIVSAIDISASPQKIWTLMTDCTAALTIVPHLESCTVISSQPGAKPYGEETPDWDIRRHVVKYGALLPKTVSEFRTEYTPYSMMKFHKVGGDLKSLNGQWTLTPNEDGTTTRLTYQAYVALKQPVPGFLVRRAVKSDTIKILTTLKQLSEQAEQNQTQQAISDSAPERP